MIVVVFFFTFHLFTDELYQNKRMEPLPRNIFGKPFEASNLTSWLSLAHFYLFIFKPEPLSANVSTCALQEASFPSVGL